MLENNCNHEHYKLTDEGGLICSGCGALVVGCLLKKDGEEFKINVPEEFLYCYGYSHLKKKTPIGVERVFSEVITIEQLAQKIMEVVQKIEAEEWEERRDQDADSILDKAAGNIRILCGDTIIDKDLNVEFDWENWETKEGFCGSESIIGFHTLDNGLSYLGVTAGGDWEMPVFFIIYWDGQNLRAYIPTEGNYWNTDINKAYGNEEDSDDENCLKRFGCNENDIQGCDYECAKIIKDILDTIKPSIK